MVFISKTMSAFPSCLHVIFWMSAVARKKGVIVLAENQNYMVSHKDCMTKSWYALLTGVCIKIDIHISVASPSDYSQPT